MRKKLAIGGLVLACVAAFGLGGAALAGAFGDDGGREMSADDAARAGAAPACARPAVARFSR